jgi:uncharacterized SAM-binding protein YcdF (DUF218 family)
MPDPVRLGAAPEIIVVLGGKIGQLARARAGAALARERPQAALILSGRAGFEEPPELSEAEIMARVLRAGGISEDRIFLEDESRDTIGNALLTAIRYLRDIAPRPVTVVTSPFHLERALFIFHTVLGPTWQIAGHASAPTQEDTERAPLETKYLSEVRSMLAGIEPGDLRSIAAQLRARWPEFYNQVKRLDL